MTALRRSLVNVLVLVALCVPLLKYCIDLGRGVLPDPIEAGLNRAGFWALTWLMVTLACTPAKWFLGWNWPLQNRRHLGVGAFCYALLHFVTYVAIDQGLDFAALVDDVLKRKFMTVGFVAFILLIPLAATSTQGMIKRLGFKRWKLLHRLIYISATLGVVHFIWRVKKDLSEPLIFAALLGVLLGVRVWRAGAGAGRVGE